jgi:hypothetical protein
MASERKISPKIRSLILNAYVAGALTGGTIGTCFGTSAGGWLADRSPESRRYFEDSRNITRQLVKAGIPPREAGQAAFSGDVRFDRSKLPPEVQTALTGHKKLVDMHAKSISKAMQKGALFGGGPGVLAGLGVAAAMARRRKKEMRSMRRR